MKTRTALLGFLGMITLAWAWDALWIHPFNGSWPWVIRQHTIYLTGLYAMALMSLVMFLATRPAWLESSLGGMDKVYRLHKYAGIWAIVFGAMHWVSKLAGTPLKALIDAADRPAREVVLALMSSSRSLAKDLGEWAIYLLIIMLVLTLWKRFPYRSWRLLHKIMPVLYLLLVFHTVALMPLAYWQGPTGVLQAILLIAGTLAAIATFAGVIGRARRHDGRIKTVHEIGENTVEVVCEMHASWPGHQAGQFAFVTFDHAEGAHPFTIASADQGKAKLLRFEIKGLGDYTKTLAQRLACGQTVSVEGPYGRFTHGRGRAGAMQAWVAGGIGITPFLAWLDEMRQGHIEAPSVQLHYCVNDAQKDPFVKRVHELCSELPSVELHVHETSKGERLDAHSLRAKLGAKCVDAIDIWFCGPTGFARSLKQGFSHEGGDVQIRQEAFDMR